MKQKVVIKCPQGCKEQIDENIIKDLMKQKVSVEDLNKYYEHIMKFANEYLQEGEIRIKCPGYIITEKGKEVVGF